MQRPENKQRPHGGCQRSEKLFAGSVARAFLGVFLAIVISGGLYGGASPELPQGVHVVRVVQAQGARLEVDGSVGGQPTKAFPCEDIVSHPLTDEILAVRPGDPIDVLSVTETGGRRHVVKLRSVPARELGAVVLAQCELDTGGWYNLAGTVIGSSFGDGTQEQWEDVSGEWQVVNGQLRSGMAKGWHDIPMIVHPAVLQGDVQVSFDVRIEKLGKEIQCPDARDITCVLVSTKDAEKARTVTWGSERRGGVSLKSGNAIDSIRELAKRRRNFNVSSSKQREKEAVDPREKGARVGRTYHVRILKAGHLTRMWVDNRLIQEAEAEPLDDPFRVWLVAPESEVVFDNFQVVQLPPGFSPSEASIGSLALASVLRVDGDEVWVENLHGMSIDAGAIMTGVSLPGGRLGSAVETVCALRVSEVWPRILICERIEGDSPERGQYAVPGNHMSQRLLPLRVVFGD